MLVVADSKIPHAEEAFKQFGEVKILPTPQVTWETVKNADAVLVRSETVVDASFLSGTNVRFVGSATIGTNHIDLEYLEKHNIGYASCPGSNANSVGEYVLAALLEVSNRLGIPLRGKTLGIVGHGNTGRSIEEKAKAIGMEVLLNDPPLARETKAKKYLPLDALSDADFISLHVPLTKAGEDSTFHLFGEKRFLAMKGVLINSSRGAVVETKALLKALRSGRLRACVLDVWEHEPNIDAGLVQLVTIGTPHIAGYSYDGKLNATKMLQEAIGKFFHLSFTRVASDEADELQDISLPETPVTLETLLRKVVAQCYSIDEDDRNLRHLLGLPPIERVGYFRLLRSRYRVRREFHRYVVDASEFDEQTRGTFASLRFRINDLKDAA